MNRLSIFFTILALAVVYVIGSTFFTIELERLIEQTITPYIISNSDVSALNQEVYSGIGQFMNSNHVQLIGYTCIILMVLIALLGLMTEKKGLTILGSMAFILPTYAYFILHMSFLAGLGILTALWAPFWGDLVRLGDVAYLPYMAVVYPFSLVGLDVRRPFIGLINDLGLLLFILGVLAWFYARFQKKGTANFWVYRFTRHPQYLGWIIWSYGLMLQVALRKDTVLQNVNPGASLPWAISTLIIICVALSEEIYMRRQHGVVYEQYMHSAPFMFPLPPFIKKVFSAPFRYISKKDQPENRWHLLCIFVIYLAVIILLSLPFVLFHWPPEGGWMNWPFEY